MSADRRAWRIAPHLVGKYAIVERGGAVKLAREYQQEES